jgi:creatinine amidohydrolase
MTWENWPSLPKDGATAEMGKLLFEEYVKGITKAVTREFGLGRRDSHWRSDRHE